MFIGEYQHNMDPKGRLAIPAKFRADLAHGAVLTRGLDNCLFLFPAEEWEKLAEKLKNLPMTQSDARAFVRLMFAGAAEVEIDKQGRILVPSYLATYAGIEKNTVVAGLFNRIEIWQADRWQSYKEKAESETEAITAQLAELGI